MLSGLVDRFGAFVREYHAPPDVRPPETPFPDTLSHLREHVSHHLIPLVLIARSDPGPLVDAERDVIVVHCLDLARSTGLAFSGDEHEILDEYVADFHPSLAQLEPALHRLSGCDHAEVVALIKAARAVILADGVTTPEETKLLAELEAELGKLGA